MALIRVSLSIVLVLVVTIVCVALPSVSAQDECKADNHECWYVKDISIRTTTIQRKWYCLWICKKEITVYRTVKRKVCDCCPGWIWKKGDEKCIGCDSQHYGLQCRDTCSCQDDQLCDHKSGECYYQQVYNGSICTNVQCNTTCNNTCVSAQICNHTTNTCQCPPGWHGETCDSFECAEGFFGEGCTERCMCENNATCDSISGICNCLEGWTGRICNETCGPSSYGINCTQMCNCSHLTSGLDRQCYPIDGECVCPAGLYGQNCLLECPDGLFGSNCRQMCTCDNVTQTCNTINGSCSKRMQEPDTDRITAGATDSAVEPSGMSNVGPVVGASVAIIILFGFTIITIIWIRRKKIHAKNKRMVQNSTGIANITYEVPKADVRYDNIDDTHLHDNQYPGATVSTSNPCYAKVWGATKPPQKPGGMDNSNDYSHLDRGVVRKHSKTSEHDDNEAYDSLGLTQSDEYGHLDRGHRGASMRFKQNDPTYDTALKSEEEKYNSLDHGAKRPIPTPSNQYEVALVNRI